MDIDPIQLIRGTLESMLTGFIERLPQIGIALIVLLLTLLVARVIRAVIAGIMKSTGTRKALIRLSTNLIGIASWIVGVAVAVTIVFPSVTPAQLIAGLGLTSVAIGFAFKDVFENFLAGVIILVREKMRINDFIECEGVSGVIEDISVRETHIRETDGELVIVPNAFLFKNPLKIQTDRELKRADLTVGVDYDADLEDVTQVLECVLNNCNSVDKDMPREVACISFGGSSIDFKLLWWAASKPGDQRKSYHEVALSVKQALDEASIAIPFPQTTLSFRDDVQPIRLASQDMSESRKTNGRDC